MATGSSQLYELVFDGSEYGNTRAYMLHNLQTGTLYRFKVSAVNQRGEGPMSDALTTFACEAPSNLQTPERALSTASSLTLNWSHP